MILVPLAGDDGRFLTALTEHPLATPVALQSVVLAIALCTVDSIPLHHELDTI